MACSRVNCTLYWIGCNIASAVGQSGILGSLSQVLWQWGSFSSYTSNIPLSFCYSNKKTTICFVYVYFDYLTTFSVAQIYDLCLPFPLWSVYLVVAAINYTEQCVKIGIFDVCVSVHHIWNWREIPTWCNNLFIIINNSTCFGHLYAHLQEY